MSGIYIHIPFCKKACHYCNFHFSTQIENRDNVFKSILKELRLQKDYLANEKVQSIYLGGGTPSLLTINQLGAPDLSFFTATRVDLLLSSSD